MAGLAVPRAVTGPAAACKSLRAAEVEPRLNLEALAANIHGHRHERSPRREK